MNKTNFDAVVVVDLEATCWLGQPPPGERSEIIEIGVAVVKPTGDIFKNESILVKPCMSNISDFCTELTGHSLETLKDGMPFSSALNRLIEKHGSRNRPWVSWGNYDRRMLKDQCDLMSLEYPMHHTHFNAKDMFSLAQMERKSFGVEKALRYLDAEFKGRPHSGKDDAYNIASLFRFMMWGYTL